MENQSDTQTSSQRQNHGTRIRGRHLFPSHEALHRAVFVPIAGAAARVCAESTASAFLRAVEHFVGRYSMPGMARHAVTAEDTHEMRLLMDACLQAVNLYRKAGVDEENPAQRRCAISTRARRRRPARRTSR